MDRAGQLRAELHQLVRATHAAAGRPSIRELELRTGVSDSVVSRALTGDRLPRRGALLALAAALGADPEEWGWLWDDHSTAQAESRAARRTAQAESRAARRAARQPTRCAVDGCPNKPHLHHRYCGTHERHAAQGRDLVAGGLWSQVHPPTCSVEDCDRPYRARGLCKGHYSRWLKNRPDQPDQGETSQATAREQG